MRDDDDTKDENDNTQGCERVRKVSPSMELCMRGRKSKRGLSVYITARGWPAIAAVVVIAAVLVIGGLLRGDALNSHSNSSFERVDASARATAGCWNPA